jgi:integrase
VKTLKRQVAGAKARQPGGHTNPNLDAKVKATLSKVHVFVSTQNTPLSERNLHRKFVACLKKAGIESVTKDADGQLVSHVDLHSLRVTFATNLIKNGADLVTVKDLLGHSTLTMVLRYAKMAGQGTSENAISRLSYGAINVAKKASGAKCRPNVAKSKKPSHPSTQLQAG